MQSSASPCRSLLQRLHACCRGKMTGVPSSPVPGEMENVFPVSSDNCVIHRFGQASPHCPQRMHFERNSSSGSAPGGRMHSARVSAGRMKASPVPMAAPRRAVFLVNSRRVRSICGMGVWVGAAKLLALRFRAREQEGVRESLTPTLHPRTLPYLLPSNLLNPRGQLLVIGLAAHRIPRSVAGGVDEPLVPGGVGAVRDGEIPRAEDVAFGNFRAGGLDY